MLGAILSDVKSDFFEHRTMSLSGVKRFIQCFLSSVKRFIHIEVSVVNTNFKKYQVYAKDNFTQDKFTVRWKICLV